MNGNCRHGDKCFNKHPQNTQRQGESGSRRRQAQTTQTPQDKLSDFVTVHFANGQRDHTSINLPRKTLRSCTWDVSNLATHLDLA
jgi:hypothetical protein